MKRWLRSGNRIWREDERGKELFWGRRWTWRPLKENQNVNLLWFKLFSSGGRERELDS